MPSTSRPRPAEYYARADDELLIVLQCEHIDAVRNFDEVYSVPGIDAVFVGPNDLAASMRDRVRQAASPEVFKQALADILAGCKRIKVPAGIHTFSIEEAKMRIDEGWQFIAINSELKFMTEAAKSVVAALGRSTGEVARY